jgi:glycosyltransferase involved in cell wall biosynthesis
MMSKSKILVWSDYVGAGTGFGVVSKYVLRSLHSTGLYDISQLAINYHGEFFDQNEFPYQIVPAKLKDPKDPYGQQAFINTVANGDFDYVWIMNDTFVVEKVGRKLPTLLQQMEGAGKKVPVIIYYYPVDCHILPEAVSMLNMADVVVAYTEFGKAETLKVVPDIESKMKVVPHGTDSSIMKALPEADRAQLRYKLLKVSPQTFVWANVNRNSPRKDLPRTIMAFKRFKEEVPDSRLYLHAMRNDVGGNLNGALRELGLSDKTDVIFPDPRYGPHNPLPPSVLNMFYNVSDAFVTTSLGEGWGLTHLDAMVQGIPVLCPDNTVFPEQLDHGKRGYLYECKNKVWVDSSGYRGQGMVDDITEAMLQVYRRAKSGEDKEMCLAAQEYANNISWDNVGEMWIKIFADAKRVVKNPTNPNKLGEVL